MIKEVICYQAVCDECGAEHESIQVWDKGALEMAAYSGWSVGDSDGLFCDSCFGELNGAGEIEEEDDDD